MTWQTLCPKCKKSFKANYIKAHIGKMLVKEKDIREYREEAGIKTKEEDFPHSLAL